MKRAELRAGELVRVSDGQPEPPKHHTKKHRRWACNNFEGYFLGVTDCGGLRARIDKDGSGIMVNVMPLEWVQPIEVQP